VTPSCLGGIIICRDFPLLRGSSLFPFQSPRGIEGASFKFGPAVLGGDSEAAERQRGDGGLPDPQVPCPAHPFVEPYKIHSSFRAIES